MLTATQRDGYLKRLGVGARQPTDELLSELHVAHLQRVPFENLDIHDGTTIRLDADALMHKLLERQRGGFCYELNGAFALLLESLGYGVERLEARVFSDGEPGPRWDHVTLAVTPPGGSRFLVDVGFGACFTQPLPSVIDGDLEDPAGTFQLVGVADDEVDLLQDGQPQYRFRLVPRTLTEFAPGLRFHTTSPDSHFTRSRVATRLTLDGGRVTIAGDDRLIHAHGGERSERALERDAARAAYRDELGLEVVPPVPAPGLREVAETWWEVERDPVVTWHADRTTFDLVDPQAATNRLRLARLAGPASEPEAVAEVLAEGLAACDFPPTEDAASAPRVAATLRAARRPERPAGQTH